MRPQLLGFLMVVKGTPILKGETCHSSILMGWGSLSVCAEVQKLSLMQGEAEIYKQPSSMHLSRVARGVSYESQEADH